MEIGIATASDTAAGRRITAPIVVAPAPIRVGGLGGAAAEFFDGLEVLGYRPSYVGLQPTTPIGRAAASRPFRRAFGMVTYRRLSARAVRRAVPPTGWDLAYAIPGAVPIERGSGLRVIYQATRHPAVEWAALRRGERETGGRGDLSTSERRRREHEIERADLIHVTSRAVCEELLEAGVAPERLVLSPHGVDLKRYTPGVKADVLKIAFVGPLSLRKGVDIVAELRSRLGRNAVIEAVGGPTCPWSRRIAERADFATGTSVPETLRTAHALVLPSRSDGFSFVVLEALASGTVPIVTPEVGASEIVRRLDARLVIDRTEFAETTVELLARLDLVELSVRARALAKQFDRRRTSKATVSAVIDRAASLLAR